MSKTKRENEEKKLFFGFGNCFKILTHKACGYDPLALSLVVGNDFYEGEKEKVFFLCSEKAVGDDAMCDAGTR